MSSNEVKYVVNVVLYQWCLYINNGHFEYSELQRLDRFIHQLIHDYIFVSNIKGQNLIASAKNLLQGNWLMTDQAERIFLTDQT